MMKFHTLRDFVTVAECGSLRAAARKLDLAQPSLTKSIQLLEKDLGVALFERNARGAVLTAAGKAFLIRAEAALSELQRGQDEINQLKGESGGTIAVGLSAAPALICVADVLKEFRKKFPKVGMRIIPGNFPVMFPELRNGTLDFSVGPCPAHPIGDEYTIEPLFKNTRAVVCRNNHPLKDRRRLAELIDAEWLVTGAIGAVDSEHHQLFAAYGLETPQAIVQCEYMTAILALLAATDLLAVLPRQWVESKVTGGLLTEIKVQETLPGADIVVIRKVGLPLTPAAEYLMTLIRRHTDYYVQARSDR